MVLPSGTVGACRARWRSSDRGWLANTRWGAVLRDGVCAAWLDARDSPRPLFRHRRMARRQRESNHAVAERRWVYRRRASTAKRPVQEDVQGDDSTCPRAVRRSSRRSSSASRRRLLPTKQNGRSLPRRMLTTFVMVRSTSSATHTPAPTLGTAPSASTRSTTSARPRGSPSLRLPAREDPQRSAARRGIGRSGLRPVHPRDDRSSDTRSLVRCLTVSRLGRGSTCSNSRALDRSS